jgi:hypothetical protein
MILRNCISLLFFGASLLLLNAQVPQKFNYQGAARNAQGQLVTDKAIRLRASIQDNFGQVAYSEIHNVTTNPQGLFSMAIGGGTNATGVFSNIAWNAGDKFLKMEMDINGGNNFVAMGNSQLLSVPYALFAGNVDNTWEKVSSGISYETGSVLINPLPGSSPSYELQVGSKGDDRFTELNVKGIYAGDQSLSLRGETDEWKLFRHAVIPPNFTGNFIIATANYSDNLTQVATSFKYMLEIDLAGNVGLGTGWKNRVPRPSAKLHVVDGDIYLDSATSTNGIIMKSPNGDCWKLTVSNNGLPVFTPEFCP